jgi:hypothetical protein
MFLQILDGLFDGVKNQKRFTAIKADVDSFCKMRRKKIDRFLDRGGVELCFFTFLVAVGTGVVALLC